MKPEIEIRPAKPGDIPELANLLKELFSIERDFIFDLEKQSGGLRLLMNQPDRAVVLTAETDSGIIGMATGQLIVSTASGGYSLLVEDLVVKEEFRNHGIGKRLLEGLENWAASRNARRMQLVADKNNLSALKFYLNNGWQVSRMIGFYKPLSNK